MKAARDVTKGREEKQKGERKSNVSEDMVDAAIAEYQWRRMHSRIVDSAVRGR